MYKIGELSQLSKIPVKTLRYYDSVGLLTPDSIDKFTGYRYYSAAKLSDCYRIVALKELGFSLDEIKAQFSMPRDKIAGLVSLKENELIAQKEQTEQRINILRQLKTALKEEKSMFDIIIRKSDEIRLAYLRRIISGKADYNSVISEIRSSLPSEITGGRTVIIDYETEFRNDAADTGFGVEITGKLPKKCKLTEKIINFSDDTASLICKEEDYEDAVISLHRYTEEHGYQIIGALYKITYEDGTVEIKLPVAKLHEFDDSRKDSITVPFENDENVIGRWEFMDCVPCREMFNPERRKSTPSNEWVDELYFLPGGERYWCFGWTKGYLLSRCGYPDKQSCNPYTIEETADGTFMFIEFRAYNYFAGGKPEIWVLRKTDSKTYTKNEIMRKDIIPDIPADDTRVYGKWLVCDLVRNIDEFSPEKCGSVINYEDLYWRSAEFLDGGSMKNEFKRDETVEYLPDGSVKNTFIPDEGEGTVIDPPHVWRWVTGNVICNHRQTASIYKLKEIKGTEYLFVQWKNGDYSYGGEEPWWYVFRR